MDIIGKLGGKKFLLVIIAIFLEVAIRFFDLELTEDQITQLGENIVMIVLVFIGDQSIADGWTKGATSHVVKKAQLDAAKAATAAEKK